MWSSERGKSSSSMESSGPHHQDSGEAKIRESTAGVSRKPKTARKGRYKAGPRYAFLPQCGQLFRTVAQEPAVDLLVVLAK